MWYDFSQTRAHRDTCFFVRFPPAFVRVFSFFSLTDIRPSGVLKARHFFPRPILSALKTPPIFISIVTQHRNQPYIPIRNPMFAIRNLMSATQHGSSTLLLELRSCSLSCRWRHKAWCGSWCPRHPRASCSPIDRTHESLVCSLILIYQRWFTMTQTFRNRRKVFATSCFCPHFVCHR